MISLCISFWICTVNHGRKVGATAAVRPKILFCKNRKRMHFLNRLPQIKIFVSCQPQFKIRTQPQTANPINGPPYSNIVNRDIKIIFT